MSALDAALAKLDRVIAKRIASVECFRAIVTAVDGGRVTIRRVGSSTADTRWVPSCARFVLAVDDEVLCAQIGGQPVVIERIRRGAYAAPTFTALAAAGSTASTASSEGDDEAGMIQLVPGGTGITTGTFLEVDFNVDKPDAKYAVHIQPLSSAARTVGASVGPTSRLTTKFSLTTGTALTSGSTYQWLYTIRGYEVT